MATASPMVSLVMPDMALIPTLTISFFQMSWRMWALAVVSRPCSLKARAMAVARSLAPPSISPIWLGRSA